MAEGEKAQVDNCRLIMLIWVDDPEVFCMNINVLNTSE